MLAAFLIGNNFFYLSQSNLFHVWGKLLSPNGLFTSDGTLLHSPSLASVVIDLLTTDPKVTSSDPARCWFFAVITNE